MSQYKVRARDLVDLVNEIESNKLILAPYFQRKLVWRLAHKVDFIKTILLGYPFPEIFISRGNLDVETMQSTSSVVDGQQRLSAIREFVHGKFEVDGREYNELTIPEKEQFLRYEVAIIDLDKEQDDPEIVEIFKRLNRTFYALSSIEKLSTEYGSSEFMLVAKMLSGELRRENEAAEVIDNVDPSLVKVDPNVSQEFVEWANGKKVDNFSAFLLGGPLFTKYEIARQVHLMFTLNLMATFRTGVYARNEQVIPHLESFSDSFPDRDAIVSGLESAAKKFNQLNFSQASTWLSKSNAFSLIKVLHDLGVGLRGAKAKAVKKALDNFADAVPPDYALAAREAVNNKRERNLRARYITSVLKPFVK